MSQWTHINGIIRIDDLRKIITNKKTNWKQIILQNSPSGSEGGIQVLHWENPEKSSCASDTISIFADLRDKDRETIKEVNTWILKIITEIQKSGLIRSLIFEVEVETKEKVIFNTTYKNDKYKLSKISCVMVK